MDLNRTTVPDRRSIYDLLGECVTKPSCSYHTIAFNLVSVPFVLPLCLYILHLGVQQWRSRAKIRHTDFFTYNMVVIQLLGIVAACLISLNLLFRSIVVTTAGVHMLVISSSAVIVFQILTCLERYMAVVHPVTYLRLKSQTWTLIRNISCAYVWLQCFILTIFFTTLDDINVYFTVSLICWSFSLFLVLFCNLCVFRALIRPGPGDGAKKNQTKQRALYTITAITGTLLLKFGGDMFAIMTFTLMTDRDRACAIYLSVIWFTLPSTLVLPILFLYRNGKLRCIKTNKKRQTDLETH